MASFFFLNAFKSLRFFGLSFRMRVNLAHAFCGRQTPTMNYLLIAGWSLFGLGVCCVFMIVLVDKYRRNDETSDSSNSTSLERSTFHRHAIVILGACALLLYAAGMGMIIASSVSM